MTQDTKSKITDAVARFATYRDTSRKAYDAALEASAVRNSTRHDRMIAAYRAKESAEIACAYAREIVREMLAAEAVKAYADIIGAYVGKPAGPKTRETVSGKIAARLEERGFRGVRVWFSSSYCGGISSIAIDGEGLYGSQIVNVYGEYDNQSSGNSLVDSLNRFNGRALSKHDFPTDERTPEQFAKDFLAAEDEIDKLRKECEAKREEIANRVRIGSIRPRSWHVTTDRREA